MDLGLSPRVRGNQLSLSGVRLRARSIPACAGEPSRMRPGRSCVRVYPRVCGGTVHEGLRGVRQLGLSPRVRGNRVSGTSGQTSARSIPACAGEPPASDGGSSITGVYPRVCGGTRSKTWMRPTTWGLSPRVRGNHGTRVAIIAREGSIPACAGEPRHPGGYYCS